MPIYKINGETYNIPDSVVKEFENDNPNATIAYSVGSDKYEIPVSERDGFLKEFPNASTGEQENQAASNQADAARHANNQFTIPEEKLNETTRREPELVNSPEGMKPAEQRSTGPDLYDMLDKDREKQFKPRPVLQKETTQNEKGNTVSKPKVVQSYGKTHYSPSATPVYRDDMGNEYDPSDPEVQEMVEEQTKETPVDVEKANRDQVANMSADIDRKLEEARKRNIEENKDIQTLASKDASIKERIVSAVRLGTPGAQPTANPAAYGAMSSSPGLAPSKEVLEYSAAKRYLTDAQRIIDEADHNAQAGTFEKWLESSFAGGAARGFGQKLFDVSTWDMGITDAIEAANMSEALKAFDEGKPLTESQQAMLDAKAVELATNAYFGSYVGRGYKAGQVTGESLPFMLEMMLNPAAGTGKAIQNRLVRYALKRFGRQLAGKAVKKATGKVLTKSVGAAARVAGDIAGSAAMTGTTGMVGVTADTMNRMNGDIQYNTEDDGRSVFAGHGFGKGFGQAFREAYTARTIENFSEMFGEYFSPLLNVAGKASGKMLDKIGLGKVNEFIDAVSASDMAKLVNDFESNARWNGTIGEYAEEVVGGIMNAIAVGDQTLDTDKDTGVFNLENNIDTLLGVSLLGGAISTVKTAGYRTPKYRARQDMVTADENANRIFGNPDTWGDIRNTIAVGNDEEVEAKLEEVRNNPDLTREQKLAAMNYAAKAYKYKGMLMAEQKRREEQNPVQTDLETSFDNGYTLEGQEQNDAKNMYDLQRQRMEETFEPDIIQAIDENPIQAVSNISMEPEMQQMALDYVNAKATYDGMIQRVQDDIDGRIAASDAMIDGRANEQDGMIHPATMKVDNRQVYIVSGNVATFDDGTVDRENSDESIILRDAETGKLEFADPRDVLSIDAPIDAAQEKQMAADQIRSQFAQEAANKIDGVLAFNEGDTYQVLGEDGQMHEAQIMPTPLDDAGNPTIEAGNVVVSIDGAEPVVMQSAQVQQMADNANLARLQQFEQEKAASLAEEQKVQEAPTFSQDDEVTLNTEAGPVKGIITNVTDDGYEVYTEQPVNGKTVNLFTQEELTALTQVPEQQEEGLSEIPTDQMPMNGEEPDFMAVEPQRTRQYLYNEAGLTPEEADQFIDANKKEADKALEKIQNKKPKIGTSLSRYKREQAEWQKEVDAAQAVSDYWQTVKAEQEEQQFAEATEDAAGRSSVLNEQKSQKEQIDAAKKMYGLLFDDDMSVAQDVYELVAMNLPKNLSWEGREGVRGVQQELGALQRKFGNNGDTKAFNSYLAKKGEGVGFDEAVHMIWESPQNQLEDGEQRFDTEEIRQALIDMFIQADKPGYFENYVINNRIAKAELLRSSMDRYEAAIKAEDEAIMQQTGMTADEYHDWIASLESMVTAQAEFENSEEYFNTIDNERIEELASGSGETGASAVQGPESVEAGAEADGAEGTGENDRLKEFVEAARAGDKEAQERLNSYGIKWEKKPVVRFVSQGEADSILAGNRYEGRFGDGRVDVTNSTEPTTATNAEYRVTFKDDLDWTLSDRLRMKNEELGDGYLMDGYGLDDVATIEKRNADGSYSAVYDANNTTSEISDTKQEKEEKNDVRSAIAAAEAEVNTEPTDAQKEAGNYKMGHVTIDGLDITIENPKGSTRSGKDASGKEWSQVMNNTYGYIRGTEGVDGDHIDVFLSEEPEFGKVYVVDQVNKDGSFDEHKVMYGFRDMEIARKAYLSNYEEGWTGLGAITEVSKDEFKKWVESSHRKTKPFSEYKSVKTEGDVQLGEQPKSKYDEAKEFYRKYYTLEPLKAQLKEQQRFVEEGRGNEEVVRAIIDILKEDYGIDVQENTSANADGTVAGNGQEETDLFGDEVKEEEKKETKPKTNQKKIDDFGEKIGGARKDVARDRIKDSANLTGKDLQNLKKGADDILSRDNIIRLFKEGQMDEDTARSFLALNNVCKTILKNGYGYWKEYILNKYRDAAVAWEEGGTPSFEVTEEDINKLLQYSPTAKREAIIENFNFTVTDPFNSYVNTYKAINYPAVNRRVGQYVIKDYTNMLSRHVVTPRPYWFMNGYRAQRGYPYKTYEEAVNKMLETCPVIEEKAKKKSTSKAEHGLHVVAGENYGYVVKSRNIPGNITLSKTFNTREQAEEYLQENLDRLIERESSLVDALMGSNIGMAEREGIDYREGRDVTPEDFLNEFGFRGVEFGNWVPQGERQMYLNKTYDAIKDFCSIIGISPKAFSLGGRLGLAFGARGTSRALAHYEPAKEVINLTRMRGVGSLAHEWFHALDNYLAKQKTGNTSDMATVTRDVVRDELAEVFKDMVYKLHSMDYDRRSNLAGPYWGSREEEFARLFQSYIFNRLAALETKSPILVREDVLYDNAPEDVKGHWPYPSVEENKEMEPYFDNLFKTIQERTDENGNVVLFHAVPNSTISKEVSSEEAAMRDAVVDLMREAGIDVITDVGLGQQTLDENTDKVSLQKRLLSLSDAEKFIEQSLKGKKQNQKFSIELPATTQKKVRNAMGRDFDSHNIDANGIVHAKTNHGVKGKKLTNESIPLRDEDFKLAPYIMVSPDRVEQGSMGPDGRTSIRFYKDLSNGYAVVVEKEEKNSPDDMGTINMWAEKSSRVTDARSNKRPLQSTSTPPNNATDTSSEKLNGVTVITSFDAAKIRKDAETAIKNDEKLREMRVYHGSGADFDRFDHSHMGEGEGAQAFGWGSYVTQVEGIGKKYATAVSNRPEGARRVLYKGEDFRGVSTNEWPDEKEGAFIDIAGGMQSMGKSAERSIDDLRTMTEHSINNQKKAVNHAESRKPLLDNILNYLNGVTEEQYKEDKKSDFKDVLTEEESRILNYVYQDTNNLQEAIEEVEFMLDNNKKLKSMAVRRIPELEERLKYLNEFDSNDFTRESSLPILYTVDVPDEKDALYLDYTGRMGEQKQILDAVDKKLTESGWKREEDGIRRIFTNPYQRVVLTPNQTGADLYEEISYAAGGAKAASEFLNSIGVTGIKYPADYYQGGTPNGDSNYVIFNEDDLKITEKARLFRTSNGQIYGYTIGGKVFIDPSIATSETPIHEYVHLWAEALRKANPQAWGQLKNEILGQEDVLNYVKERYPNLKGDELVEEVFAHYAGSRGAERLREEQAKAMDEAKGVFEKAKVAVIFDKIRKALNRFWNMARDLFAGKVNGIEKMKAEDFADMAFNDLLNKFNPLGEARGTAEKEVGKGYEISEFELGKGMLRLRGIEEANVTVDGKKAGRVYKMDGEYYAETPSMDYATDLYPTADEAVQALLKRNEDEGLRYRLREDAAPKKTGKGYKVFVLKDGKLYPPMVANPNGEETPVGVWLDADAAPIVGETKTGRPQVKQGGKGTQGGSGTLAYRPGWHLGTIPYALQFNRKDENGEKALFPANFVWAEVEYANDIDYQQEANKEGMNENGKYQHSLAGLKHVPVDGSYMYRTNPNPETDPWIITGAMKVNRILRPSEVDAMVREAGREPQQRQEGAITDAQVDELNNDIKANSVEEIINNAASKYSGKQVNVVRYDKMTDNDLLKMFGVTDEDIQSASQEEVKEWVDEIKNEIESKNIRAFHNPLTDEIVIFADRIKPSKAEESYFHENIHSILQDIFGDKKRDVVENYWNTVQEGLFTDKAKIERLYKNSPNDIPEEFFVHELSRAMAKGRVDEVLNLVESEKDKETTEQILNTIGYDRGTEEALRKGEREDKEVLSDDKGRASGSLRGREGSEGKGLTPEESLAASRQAGYSRRQHDAWVERQQKAMRQAAEDTVGKLNLFGKVDIRENADGLTGRKAKSKGWFDPKTGMITIILGNHSSVADVIKTVLHEAVAHYGLRRLFGSRFDTFLDNVYANASREVRQEIIKLVIKHNWDFREATEEYLARLAENTDFERAKQSGWWSKIKTLFLDMLHELGLDRFSGSLSDNELRYMLWRSYENLAEPGRYRNVFAEAKDIAMQYELGVGDYSEEALNTAKAAEPEEGLRHRDGEEVENVLRDRSLGLHERITAAATKLSENHKEDKTLRNDAMKAIGGNLADIRKAMGLQRKFDVSTVKRVADLANILMNGGYLSGMNQVEVKRLLAAVKNSVGREDIEGSVQKVMDIMIDNQLKNAEAALHQIETIKGSKVDAKGVEVQGNLDPTGQHVMKVFKKTRDWDKSDIEEAIADAQQRMGSNDKAVADEASNDYIGLQLARDYAENIKDSKTEEVRLRNEIKKAHDEASREERQTDSYRQYIESIEEAIRQNRIERAQAYFDLVGRIIGSLQESIKNVEKFKNEEKIRVREIQHNANSDMEGKPSNEHYKPSFTDKLVNNPVAQFLFAPLSTFDQMLRLFGSKSANGEGYLYNRFMRGWVDARQKEISGVRSKFAALDKKAKEMFGGKVKSWGDLIRYVGKLPKATVTFWDGGEMREHELTQGNLMYIYMVNKMVDGKMKLRKMGITEEDVANIEAELDPRLVELADWLQDEFLVQTRNEYNETHKKAFGANMAAIEHYFPLKVLANARTDKAEDLDNPHIGEGISTTTGSIIKRRRNSLALDVTGADALNVILDHIAQMEHWNAFVEFNRDLNTLRTYKHFRNQVKNMTTIYGSGDKLWKKFNDVSQMAAGTYRPPRAVLDEAAVNIAKGVTAAKVSFRLFTALKQLASMPAFISEASAKNLIADIINPVKAWKWSMENLPILEERWKSRIAGDPRLMKSDMDWNNWRNNVVQIASRVGMSPNAFIDALTVSIGAHAIYKTKYSQYKKDGYSDEEANKKAIQDAEVAYNETQQSNEGPFTSTIQVDRSWFSVLFTIFRNASMSYQRQLHDAVRNLKRNMTPKQREESIDFMKKQYIRDGIDAGQAEENAKRKLNRQLRKDAIRVALFGGMMQLVWNLFGYLPYLLFGGDDDEKDKMWDDIIAKTAFGWTEGLTGGDVASQAGEMLLTGEGNPEYLIKDMPITSDAAEMLKKMYRGKKAEAFNDLVSLAVQSGIGVNPESITDAIVGIIDACGDDPELAREAAIFISRVMQVPQSQINKMYFDEIGMDGEEVSKYTPEQLAERYARFQVKNGRLFTPWSWDDEDELDKQSAKAKTAIKQRMKNFGDVTDEYEKYENVYKDVARKVKESKNMMKKNYTEAARIMSEIPSEDYVTYQVFKNLDGGYDKIAKLYLSSQTADKANLYKEFLENYRKLMVEALGAKDAKTREDAINAIKELNSQLPNQNNEKQ